MNNGTVLRIHDIFWFFWWNFKLTNLGLVFTDSDLCELLQNRNNYHSKRVIFRIELCLYSTHKQIYIFMVLSI